MHMYSYFSPCSSLPMLPPLLLQIEEEPDSPPLPCYCESDNCNGRMN